MSNTSRIAFAMLVAMFIIALASPADAYRHKKTVREPDGTVTVIDGEVTAGQIIGTAVGVVIVKLFFDPPGEQFFDIIPPQDWWATTDPNDLPFFDPDLQPGNFVAFVSTYDIDFEHIFGDYSFGTCLCNSELNMQYRRGDTGEILEEGPLSFFSTEPDEGPNCPDPDESPCVCPQFEGFAAGADVDAMDLGFNPNTTIIEAPGSDSDCDLLDCNWDGTAENGYCWQFGGAVSPDYGSWAECYENTFVCEAHFYFTQTGYYVGQCLDVFVWEDDGGNPGNVLCATLQQRPGPIAFWPSCSAHKIPVNCQTNGSHFIGFWGRWPGLQCGWFVCSDEDGLPGCPRTKFAPGIGYPTGWGHPNLVPIFQAQSLGICEWSESVTATEQTTWGRIKNLQQ